MVQLKKAGAESRQVVKVVDWRPKSATAVDWRLQSAVVGVGKSRWLTSAGMPWLARVSAWAVADFGPDAMQIDYGPSLFEILSIGFLYPFFN